MTADEELADAYLALPENVSGDAAPTGTLLGDRIRAMSQEIAYLRNTLEWHHNRHVELEGQSMGTRNREQAILNSALEALDWAHSWRLKAIDDIGPSNDRWDWYRRGETTTWEHDRRCVDQALREHLGLPEPDEDPEDAPGPRVARACA